MSDNINHISSAPAVQYVILSSWFSPHHYFDEMEEQQPIIIELPPQQPLVAQEPAQVVQQQPVQPEVEQTYQDSYDPVMEERLRAMEERVRETEERMARDAEERARKAEDDAVRAAENRTRLSEDYAQRTYYQSLLTNRYQTMGQPMPAYLANNMSNMPIESLSALVTAVMRDMSGQPMTNLGLTDNDVKLIGQISSSVSNQLQDGSNASAPALPEKSTANAQMPQMLHNTFGMPQMFIPQNSTMTMTLSTNGASANETEDNNREVTEEPQAEEKMSRRDKKRRRAQADANEIESAEQPADINLDNYFYNDEK